MFRNKQGNKQSQQYGTGSKEEGGARDDGILRKKKIIRYFAHTSLLIGKTAKLLVVTDCYELTSSRT